MDFTRTIVAAGIVLATALGTPAASLAANPPDQLTDDDSGSGCASVSPVPDAAADSAAWQSDCDPTGANTDGSIEIFRATEGEAPVQLTDGTACTSSHPSVSASGDRIAFESDCDLTTGNADGNVEIFLWTNGAPAELTQLTNSTGCENHAPSINGPGTFIAFDSTCNIEGNNNNGRGSEIYRVSSAGVLKQLTVDPNGGTCDSTSPSIEDSGVLVAFDSDCDLVGDNEDLAIEIFTVNATSLAVRQRTFASDGSCSSLRPSMDGDSSVIAFQGDCDFTGNNADGSPEIFTVTVAPSAEFVQITDSDDGSGCASGEPHMASSGLALAFSSYCNLNGRNQDGSIEVFQVGLGNAAGGIMRVSDGSGCSSPAGGISAQGTLVMYDSDCDPVSSNEDGSVEIFRAAACACGAPATRKETPTASDAQYALRSAVGTIGCATCECDVNDSTTVTAVDALLILKFAVGQNVTLDCPVP